MQVEIGARTDKGCVRENNEDSYRVLPALNLLVLSDGMGGVAHGEVASAMAVDIIATHCKETAQQPTLPSLEEPRAEFSERTNRLVSGIQLANHMIYQSAQQNQDQRGMGATILAAWLSETRTSLAHVGDSRAYLLRAGALEQLTADHSLVAEQVRRGVLTPQQAEKSELQSVLTRALGTEEEIEVDADELALLDGDTLLLCSDGLTRMLPDQEIAATLQELPGAQEAADRLIELAKQHGGQDNITVIVARLGPRPNAWFSKLRRRTRNSRSPASYEGGA